MVDERDRMADDVKGEGDPVELADARTSTYPDGKTGVFSTPTEGNVEAKKHPETGLEHWQPSDEVVSPTWKLWQEGTRHEWAWPCPHCDEYFIPRLGLLTWPEKATPTEARKEARLICPHCGVMIEDRHKDSMNGLGRYVAPGQSVSKKGEITGTPETAGNMTFSFWVSGICSFSSKKSFGNLAARLVAAYRSGDPKRIQAVINTDFGELFAIGGDAPDWQMVLDRRRIYKMGEVHPGACVLTCGVDVQKNRLVYSVRAWGPNFESWLVEKGEMWDETSKPEVWKKLAALLDKEWGGFKIRFMGVDSGYETTMVYDFCKRYPGRALPTKGDEGIKKDINVTQPDKRSEMKLFVFRPDTYKSWVVARLTWPQHEPGGWWVPSNIDEDYCKQMTSEKKVMKPSRRVVWVQVRKDNHFFDCEVINYLIINYFTAGNPKALEGAGGSQPATSGRKVRSRGVSN